MTHALASLALARAGQKQLPRFGTAIVVVAGVAPDLDFASYVGGPFSFLRFHRAALHSVAGGAVVACATVGAFYAFDRWRQTKPAAARDMPHTSFAILPALVAAAAGVAGHILLDIASGIGVRLFWPFGVRAFAWDLLTNLDPWILIALAAGLLIPPLFRLISEEIGDRRKRVRGRVAAIIALAMVAAYIGLRAEMHSNAIDLLLSREYHGQVALSAGAFPSSMSPFDWRGVAVTDNTIEEVDVPVGTSARFDPDRGLTHYKPDDSPALRAGQAASATQAYLKYARFPLAHVERIEDDYRFELHDMQFAGDDESPSNVFVRVDLDTAFHVRSQEFLFASSPNP